MATTHTYLDFSTYLSTQFAGKVQKLTLNAGFTCPNRDGTLGYGGCSYCDNATFSPHYLSSPAAIGTQIDAGKHFFARKYPSMRYLAYFQSYTSTYAQVEVLKGMYEEVLRHEGVVGIVIATRPDCMPPELLDYLTELNRRTWLLVEYGVESTRDDTLRLVNRNHTFQTAADTIQRTAARGIRTGAHFIIGLPKEEPADWRELVEKIIALPLTTIKFHQLQVVKHTAMAQLYRTHPEWFVKLTPVAYMEVMIDVLSHLPADRVIDRFVSQVPPDRLIAPRWNIKNYQFTQLLVSEMLRREVWQGKYYESKPIKV